MQNKIEKRNYKSIYVVKQALWYAAQDAKVMRASVGEVKSRKQTARKV
jgi:hypothetical protein